jgi:serine/threonine protein phosphatase 1
MAFRWLNRVIGNKARVYTNYFATPLAPDVPFYVVGDIHGRADLLEQVLRPMLACRDAQPIVFVGDYIDRGSNSKEVLERLFQLSCEHPDRVKCLMGNHEELMLNFLRDPHRYHHVWLMNGGDKTLESFAVPPLSPPPTNEEILYVRDSLRTALGPELLAWLQSLCVQWHTGNVWVTHAGADPERAMNDQIRKVMVWGHPDFSTAARRDGQWVVHGHTVVQDITQHQGRISVDTGAYYTGRLSAVSISQAGISPVKDSARLH